MKKFTKIILSLLMLLSGTSYSQDMQFSQFYAAPTYLNPSFTGANVCSRLSTNYRKQWPSIPGGFRSQIVAYDHYIPRYNSGLGLMFTNDRAGSGGLGQVNISALYAQQFQLSRFWAFRSGFQVTYNVHDINFYNLVFGDQLTRDDALTSIEAPTEKNTYFDLSTGGLFFSKKYWIGFAAHHVNLPNQSLKGDDSNVPIKYSIHGGTKVIIRKKDTDDDWEQSISPTFNLRRQGKFRQLDIGTYFSYGLLNFGVWYRGIPILDAWKSRAVNHDAVVLLAGLTIDRFKFAYSYDFTVSRLIGNTGGSHELSLSYQLCKLKPPKRKRKGGILVPCPKF